jgi:hypothetical protein
MSRDSRRVGMNGLRQAFDDMRFGARRTLNLRESLPSAAEAAARADAWLRQQQVSGADEVLIITGRGNRSAEGFSPVRDAVRRLLHVLKRRGVVAGHDEHTPGSFVVHIAPIAALWESPRRNRDRGIVPPGQTPPSLSELQPETRLLLRHLAERALEALGLKQTGDFLEAEMLRQFGAIAAGIGEGPMREARLRAALRAALDREQ